MKTIYAIVGLLLTIFVTGCQDEEYSKRSTGAVKVFASAPSTRVNYTEDDDRTLVTWKDGDKILLFTDEQGVYYTASVQNDGTTDVEFLPSGDFLQNSEGKAVYAVFSSADDYSINEKKVRTFISNDRQIEPYLYAVDTIRDGKLNLHFHHVLSYLKVSITKDMLPVSVKDGKLHHFEIQSDGFNIGTGLMEFDLDKREITDTINCNSSVSRPLDKHDFTASDFVCYVPILPRSGGGSVNVSLHKDNFGMPYYTLEKKVPEGGFLAGHVYKLTLDDYYEYWPGGIYTLEDLLAFRDATLKNESLDPWRDNDGVINIFSDIDISSIKDWRMGDNNGNIIDGNGHTILVDIVDDYYCSFMETNSGTIQNLTIEGKMTIPYSSMIIADGEYGFCGDNLGTIYNCHTNIEFVALNYEAAIGGICGTNSGTIEACTNRSMISSGFNAGGIASALNGGSIINSQNYGEVKVSKDATYIRAGGIVGHLDGGTVIGCSNEGRVTATSEQAKLGGICGYASAGTLDNNVNKGIVQGGYAAGGIMGYTYGSEVDSVLVISNCINTGAVSSEVSGGICGIVNQGVILKKNSNTGTVNGASPTVENPLEVGLDSRENKKTK